ncbi:hypothetical protein DSL72_006479 [Monilinia vaccinii-corymbosi]|uniref:SH3 domain-containing protein n=1 Tax=Monilinia vaccinii-corymbosi TaxID=61207 RepID=A0A8A3PNW0_9HELO|nr:hypothetical protein DSL72_006479 [Monilinia vaccinii-corymbosi]
MFPIMVPPLVMATKPVKESQITRAWKRMSSESSASKSKVASEKNSNFDNLKRTSTVTFGGKKSSLQQEQQRRTSVQLAPITKEMAPVGEESAGELGDFDSLGINFYDHLGNKVLPQAMVTSREPGPRRALSPRAPGTRMPTMPLPKDPPIAARTPVVIRESYNRDFGFPGTPEAIVDSDTLLEELLEKTEREQSDALCPSPTSSRKNSTRVNTPKSNRQVSAAKPIVTSGAFGIRSYTAPLALAYTPTRGPKLDVTAAHSRILSLRTPNQADSEVDYFNHQHSQTSEENSGLTPETLKETPFAPSGALNSKLYRMPASPTIVKRSSRSKPQRNELYFFDHERQRIEELELENLLEDELITYESYELMISRLPSETSLNAASSPATPLNVVTPAPAPAPVSVPVAAFSQLSVNNNNPPPSYQSTPTPNLPSGPTQPPSRPEIGRATALYRYTEPDDCNFDVGDIIIIYEYMNADWWMGKNEKTGKEGVFPANYVQKHTNQPPQHTTYYGNEKAAYSPYGVQQQGPTPPGPSNPYNSAVPPMAVAEQPTDGKPSKGGEMGKKFGKKLGNAAIFGAGATIGGNIVNSIF